MAHPLDEAHAKVARAMVHLKDLHYQAVAFVNAHPYDLVPEKDDKTGRLIGVARARGPEEPVPVDFGILAGDFAHNLRSALNYLVWQLALPPVGTGPGEDTAFPIIFDRPSKTYEKPAAQRFSESQNRFLRGVRDEHRALIEKAQPYHGRHWEHLAFLALLNDGDKHRVVSSAGILGHTGPPDLGDFTGKMLIRLFPDPAIYDGAKIVEFVSIELPEGKTEAQVGMKFDLTYEIGIGDNPMIAPTGSMARSIRLVRLILQAFRGAF